jgi:hypothetical protein
MISLAILLLAWAPAQSAPGAPTGAQPQQQITVHSVEGLGAQQVVTGTPYTATILIDTTQTLTDGNRIVNHSTESVARDSAGRIRRELRISNVGALPVPGPAVIVIADPVSHLDYILDPAKHTVRISKPQIITFSPGENERAAAPNPKRRQVTRESLGTQTIDGLVAEGTRITSTLPAGSIGNEQPFSTSVETWYSRDLQTVILRKRNDPRLGQTVYRLTDIHRGEPDASLFKVPADYKVLSAPKDSSM